jgi:hypothetical protein
VGVLIAEVATEITRLFRQEIELASAELKEEAAKAGKAGGLLASAGFAGYMVAVLVSLAVVLALAEVMPAGWAAVLAAAVWAIFGALLYGAGRRRLNAVSPVPRRTVETIKEDAQWLRDQANR